MNWGQYFSLREQQKKNFWKFFIILLLLSLFYAKGFLLNGSDSVCNKINITCQNSDTEQLGSDNFLPLLNLSSNTNSNATLNKQTNQTNESIQDNETINATQKTEIKTYLDHIWIDCSPNCYELTTMQKVRIWAYRLTYTPLFILTDALLACFLSALLSLYNKYKLTKKSKGQKEENTSEKKD